MDFLRTGTFGGLFRVTFTIAATFEVVFAAVCALWSLFKPAAFKLNGAPAANIGEALLVVVILLVMSLLINAAMSAAGSGLWLLVRRRLLRPVRDEARAF